MAEGLATREIAMLMGLACGPAQHLTRATQRRAGEGGSDGGGSRCKGAARKGRRFNASAPPSWDEYDQAIRGRRRRPGGSRTFISIGSRFQERGHADGTSKSGRSGLTSRAGRSVEERRGVNFREGFRQRKKRAVSKNLYTP